MHSMSTDFAGLRCGQDASDPAKPLLLCSVFESDGTVAGLDDLVAVYGVPRDEAHLPLDVAQHP